MWMKPKKGFRGSRRFEWSVTAFSGVSFALCY